MDAHRLEGEGVGHGTRDEGKIVVLVLPPSDLHNVPRTVPERGCRRELQCLVTGRPGERCRDPPTDRPCHGGHVHRLAEVHPNRIRDGPSRRTGPWTRLDDYWRLNWTFPCEREIL